MILILEYQAFTPLDAAVNRLWKNRKSENRIP